MDKFHSQFADIVALINESRNKAIKAVNTELINLYWNVGAYISKKIAAANWGEKTVDELALFIRKNHPELKGFTRSGLFRMRQFYETYSQVAIVSPLRTQLQSTENKDLEIVAPVERQLENKDLNEIQIVASSGRQFETDDIRNTILSKLSWTHHRTIFSRCKSNEVHACTARQKAVTSQIARVV